MSAVAELVLLAIHQYWQQSFQWQLPELQCCSRLPSHLRSQKLPWPNLEIGNQSTRNKIPVRYNYLEFTVIEVQARTSLTVSTEAICAKPIPPLYSPTSCWNMGSVPMVSRLCQISWSWKAALLQGNVTLQRSGCLGAYRASCLSCHRGQLVQH